MLDSYIRRQRWLHRNLSVSVLNAYGEAMSGAKGTGPGGMAATKVDSGSMWDMLGAGKGKNGRKTG